MKKLAASLFWLFAASLFLVSCKKNTESTEQAVSPPVSHEVLLRIAALGFDTSVVERADGGYRVEGDMFLRDEDLNSNANSINMIIAKEEQYRTTNIVSGLPRTINVVSNLPNNATYNNAIDAAIARYNATDLRLRFVRTTTNANITLIQGETLPTNDPNYTGPNVFGRGLFPSSGNPGSRIGINVAYFNGHPDLNFFATILSHEMGHTVGLRHTDYFNRSYSNCLVDANNPNDEGQGSIGAINIPGTPTGEDPNSYMLACIGYPTNRPFNANDQVALHQLYGSGHAYTVTQTSCSGTGQGQYTISGGFPGDQITLRITSGGYLVWNNVGNGAGVKITGTAGTSTTTVSTAHYTNTGNTYSLTCDVPVTFTSGSITLSTTITKYNVGSGSVSGSVYVGAANGSTFTSNSLSACIGAGSGNW